MVIASARRNSSRRPSRRAACAQVTVVPESSSISVLRKGIEKGSKVLMPTGGHWPPVASRRQIWRMSPAKKDASNQAQKKAKKNITSERMKSSIP